MRFINDDSTYEWIEAWTEHKLFQWDLGNSKKLQKHQQDPSSVEQLFDLDFVYLGQVLHSGGEKRWVTLHSYKLKHWTVIWTKRNGSLRVITCRRSRRNEIEMYKEGLEE